MNAWVSGPVGRSPLRIRRQIPDVGPTPYLPVEWFSRRGVHHRGDVSTSTWHGKKDNQGGKSPPLLVIRGRARRCCWRLNAGWMTAVGDR